MRIRVVSTDIAIIGASLGGVAAALAALRLGRKVFLSERTDWLGGQLTSQGTALDEHPWVEQVGSSWAYLHLRDRIRRYYQDNYRLNSRRSVLALNPGSSAVSRLSHEPRVGHAVIESMLSPYIASGRLVIALRHAPESASVFADSVRSVRLVCMDGESKIEVDCRQVIDGTDLGELLPMCGAEHAVGAESIAETGERHAADVAMPDDQQAFTMCFAMDLLEGEDHTIDRPAMYDFWKSYSDNPWRSSQLGWESYSPPTGVKRFKPLFAGPSSERGVDLWHYRRILYKDNFAFDELRSDITLCHWQQNDYWLQPLVGGSPEDVQVAVDQAKQLSLSLLYWMQTEAPRHDGGIGYRGLRLRRDVMGTDDGLAKAPYVRESRRLKTICTIREQDISALDCADRGKALPREDSVGVSYFNIDVHPSKRMRRFLHIPCYPFQIPLGALVPVRILNLLPACKNLGTTHITNGAFRTHHAEWAVGEAAGAAATFCDARGVPPRTLLDRRDLLIDFQRCLAERLGVPLAWPTYSTHGHGKALMGNWFWPPEGIAPAEIAGASSAGPGPREWI